MTWRVEFPDNTEAAFVYNNTRGGKIPMVISYYLIIAVGVEQIDKELQRWGVSPSVRTKIKDWVRRPQ